MSHAVSVMGFEQSAFDIFLSVTQQCSSDLGYLFVVVAGGFDRYIAAVLDGDCEESKR